MRAIAHLLKFWAFGKFAYKNAKFRTENSAYFSTVVSHLAVVVGLCTDDPKDF